MTNCAAPDRSKSSGLSVGITSARTIQCQQSPLKTENYSADSWNWLGKTAHKPFANIQSKAHESRVCRLMANQQSAGPKVLELAIAKNTVIELRGIGDALP